MNLKMIKNIIVISTLLFMTHSVFAKSMDLVLITNDEDTHRTTLGLIVSDETGEVTHMFATERNAKGHEVITRKFSANQLEDGIVFLERQGRKIVTIQAQNANLLYGADLVLDYLVDGRPWATQRAQRYVNVDNTGKRWSLLIDGKAVKHLHFQSNKQTVLFSKITVGIKAIRVMK